MVVPRRSFIAALAIAVCAITAWAGISSTGSGIQQQAPTLTSDTGGNNELRENEYESDTAIRVWYESTVSINSSMQLDHVTAGASGTGTFSTQASLNGGTIASGTRLDSYYLHWDPVTDNTRLQDSSGTLSITFDSDILGIATTDNGVGGGDVGLNESDDASGDGNGNQSFQGPGALTYRNFGARGFEFGTGTNQDRFSISADRRTITILNIFNNNDSDALRIFVSAAAVPEPATLGLFGAGVLGMGMFLVKRRRRAASGNSPA